MTDMEAQAALERAAQDEVSITLVKPAGTTQFSRTIAASSTQAVINGLAILIVEVAKILNVSVSRMLSVLAVVLMAPAAEAGKAHEEKGSEERAESQ